MEREIDKEPRPGYWPMLLILFVSAFAAARWFYSGKTEPQYLCFAFGFLLFAPRAHAYRGFGHGAKLPLWTGVLAALGLATMACGLVLRWQVQLAM